MRQLSKKFSYPLFAYRQLFKITQIFLGPTITDLLTVFDCRGPFTFFHTKLNFQQLLFTSYFEKIKFYTVLDYWKNFIFSNFKEKYAPQNLNLFSAKFALRTQLSNNYTEYFSKIREESSTPKLLSRGCNAHCLSGAGGSAPRQKIKNFKNFLLLSD